MQNHSTRIILYSSLAIVLLVFMWGMRQIPRENHLAEQALRESLDQELVVLGSAVKSSTQAMKYRLLDVLKAEGNDRATRTFQDSPFMAATLFEWDQVEWKNLWYSSKSKTDFQSTEVAGWLQQWPLSKLAPGEVYFTKVGVVDGQAYFAILVPVRKPNQVPMVGVGIFPAAQFGLTFSADENREVRVFTEQGTALALTHPAYLGASVKAEPIVHEILENGEVSQRLEWTSSRGTKMIGLASRISDSNLFAAIETRAHNSSVLPAWIYLILCAVGAGIINWTLFSSVLRTVLAQLSQFEDVNEKLRRELNARAPAPVKVPVLEISALETLDFDEKEPVIPALTPPLPDEEAEAGGMVSVARVVRACLMALNAKITEMKVQVMHFGLDDLSLHADALQLQTALEEVLKNSLEAMGESENRKLTISGHKEQGRIRLTVEDTGSGIPAAQVEKVFDPFYSTKDSQGVARGLGLNVVRRVVEELRGKVKLTSEQSSGHSGTCVEITLPVSGGIETAIEETEPPRIELAEIPEISAAASSAAAKSAQHWPDISIRKPIVRNLD